MLLSVPKSVRYYCLSCTGAGDKKDRGVCVGENQIMFGHMEFN